MLLQLFISKIDTELLKAILRENFVSITAGLNITTLRIKSLQKHPTYFA